MKKINGRSKVARMSMRPIAHNGAGNTPPLREIAQSVAHVKKYTFRVLNHDVPFVKCTLLALNIIHLCFFTGMISGATWMCGQSMVAVSAIIFLIVRYRRDSVPNQIRFRRSGDLLIGPNDYRGMLARSLVYSDNALETRNLVISPSCEGEGTQEILRIMNSQRSGVEITIEQNRSKNWPGLPPAPGGLESLPVELLLKILEILDSRSFENISFVNRRFYRLAQDPHLFRHPELPARSEALNVFLLRYGQSIKYLDLRHVKLLRDQQQTIYRALPTYCPNLTTLILKKNSATQSEIEYLNNNLPLLKEFWEAGQYV